MNFTNIFIPLPCMCYIPHAAFKQICSSSKMSPSSNPKYTSVMPKMISWKLNNSSKLIRYVCNMMRQQRSCEFGKINHSLCSEIMQGKTQQIVSSIWVRICNPAEDLFYMLQAASFIPLHISHFHSPIRLLVVLDTSVWPRDWGIQNFSGQPVSDLHDSLIKIFPPEIWSKCPLF